MKILILNILMLPSLCQFSFGVIGDYIEIPDYDIEDPSIYTLNEVNPQYTYTETIGFEYLWMEKGFEYGIWTQYSPISAVTSIGVIPSQNSNCSLIHYVSGEIEQLIYYMCLNYNEMEIVHYVEFISYNDQQYKQLFTIPTNIKYEGTWIYYHLASLPYQNYYYITIMNSDYSQISHIQYTDQFPFQTGALNYNFGNSIEIGNSRFQIPLLNSFRGKIVLYLIQRYQDYLQLHLSSQEIQQLWESKSEKLQIKCNNPLSPYTLSIKLISSQIIIPQYSVTINSFQVKGWFKIIGEINYSQKFELIKISPNLELVEYSTLLDAMYLKLFYQYSSDQKPQIFIQTYSYTLPLININPNEFLMQDIIDVYGSFTEWHYISIFHSTSQLQIQYYSGQNQNNIQKTIPVNHFSNHDIQLKIGDFLDEQNANLDVTRLVIEQCQNEEPSPICNETCLTCSGPTRNDCVSCSSEQLRVFVEDIHQCACQFGTWEYNYKCQPLQKFNYEIIHLDEEPAPTKQILCPVNYIMYDGECVRCPQVMTIYVRSCYDCQLIQFEEYKLWTKQPTCNNRLESSSKTNSYSIVQSGRLNKNTYVYWFEEFILCEFCQGFQFQTSFNEILSAYFHQEQRIYIFCNSDYILFNGKCQKAIQFLPSTSSLLSPFTEYECPDICQYCVDGICMSCKDKINNYLSIFNPNTCTPCIIKNCKYCFDYSEQDYQINSYFQLNLEILYDDIVTGCAQCNQGYTYNFQTRECQFIQPIYPCIQQIISPNNELICILSQELGQTKTLYQCQNYISNCKQCISHNNFFTCIICDDGYLCNTKQNKCEQCNEEGFYKCSNQISQNNQNINFAPEIQVMIYYMTQSLLSLEYYYPTQFPYECMEGYFLFGEQCLQGCSDQCEKCDFGGQQVVECKKCLPSKYGFPVKGSNDYLYYGTDGCDSCLYQCLSCFLYQGLYQKLNPYYFQTPFSESRCAISLDGYPIDPNYGRVKFGKRTISLNKQYLASNNYTQSFFRATGSIVNIDFSYYNILDIQAVDHIINHFIIIEDLVDDYYRGIFSFFYSCNNYKEGVFTLKNQSTIFEGIQQVILSPFFYKIQSQYCNIFEFRNLIFPIALNGEDVIHKYITEEAIIKYQQIIFQSDNTERYFNISFSQLKLLHFSDIIFQNYIIQNSNIIQQNHSLEVIEVSQLYFSEVQLIDTHLLKSTFLSIDQNAMTTYVYLQNMHIKNSTLIESNFFDFLDETMSYQVNIENLYIEDCVFSNVLFFKFSKTTELTINNLQIKNTVMNNSTFISLGNSVKLTQIQIANSTLIDSTFLSISSVYPLNSLIFYFNLLSFNNITMKDSKIIDIDFKENHDISIKLQNVVHINMKDISDYDSQYYSFSRTSDSGTSIYVATIQLNNVSFNSIQTNVVSKLSYWSECFTENGLSSLIYISQFQDISISNLLISNQIFVDQIAIDINIDQNSKLDKITLTNLTFQQNLLINRQGGQQLYFIKIYIAKSMPLFINKLSFFQNVAHYYLKDISNLDSSFVSVSSYLSSIQMQEISIVDNYISNKSSSFFSIDCQEITINQLTMFNNNLKMVDFFVQDPTEELSQDIVELFIRQQFSVITKAYFGIISASTFLLNNSSFQNGYSFENNLFKMIGKEDCVLTMNNITIQNHSSFIKGKNILTSSTKTVQLIAGSIFIDSSASNLYLTLTNIKLSGIFNKLQSAFLYISPSQTINIVKIQNVLVENVFSLRNGLFFMDLDSSYSQTNSLTIENVEIANSQYEFEQYLSSLKLIEEVDLNQIYSQNGFIFISNSLVSIKKLHFSGYSISNILEIVNSKSVQLEQLEMHNIVTLSSLIVIQQSNVTIIHSRIQNIQLYDVSQLIYNSTSYNQSQFDLSSQNQCKLILRQNPKLLYDQLVQQVSHNLIISLIFRQIQSLINVELNMSTLQLYDAIYNQINSTNSIYGLVSISTYKQAKIILNQVDIVQGYYNNTGHLYIQGDCNQDVSISNSHFSKSQCLQGCAVNIDCGSLQIVNTVFEKNEAKLSGGAVKYDGKSLILKNVAFYDNFAQLGSALDIINMRLDDYSQITLNNNSNIQISEIPLSLFCQYNGQRLKSVTQIKENMRIASPTYSEVQQRLVIEANQNQYQEYLKLPSNIPLNQYKTFDEATQQYSPQNFSLQFLPLNKLEEIQRNLTTSSCTLKSNILNKNSNTILTGGSIETIYFDNSSNSYQISSVTFDPYSPEEQVLQIEIQCSLIENYVYQFNVRTYFCQMGEYYSNQGCYPCDSEKGYYSVKSNSSKCSQIDVNKIEKNTENLLKLKPGYWRTYITSEKIEKCKYDYCNGGWEVGTKSCKAGYIGALCEECDTYNQYTKASDSQCLPCKDSWQTIVSLLLMSLWTLFSIQITVKSIQEANEQYKSLMRRSKFYGIFHKYNQDVAGCLIKMLTNQVLIISAVYSFQQGLSVDFTWLGAISSPSLTNAFNFDCWLSLQNIIDILYLRLFLILALPFLYISIFIWLYLLYVISKGQKYDSSTLYIAIIYIFIITQPDIIKYCGSLLASRTISGVQWIQANLSYEYNTGNHENWLKFCVVPILLLWCVLFPVYFGTTIFINRKRLGFTVVRRKFSYLYTEYNLKCYYWEIVKIIQRELQVLVLTVFKEEIEIYVCLLFLIQFIYLKIITQIKPYNMNMLNHLEINSVQKCILILIIGLITFITVKQEMISFSIIAQILLIIITLLHLMPFIYDLMLVYIEKYQEKLQELVKLRPWIARFLPKYFENLKRKEIVRKKYQKIKVHLMNRVSSLKKFNELQIQ